MPRHEMRHICPGQDVDSATRLRQPVVLGMTRPDGTFDTWVAVKASCIMYLQPAFAATTEFLIGQDWRWHSGCLSARHDRTRSLAGYNMRPVIRMRRCKNGLKRPGTNER